MFAERLKGRPGLGEFKSQQTGKDKVRECDTWTELRKMGGSGAVSPPGRSNRHGGPGARGTTGTWVSWLGRLGSPRRSCRQTKVTSEALLPGSGVLT